MGMRGEELSLDYIREGKAHQRTAEHVQAVWRRDTLVHSWDGRTCPSIQSVDDCDGRERPSYHSLEP